VNRLNRERLKAETRFDSVGHLFIAVRVFGIEYVTSVFDKA